MATIPQLQHNKTSANKEAVRTLRKHWGRRATKSTVVGTGWTTPTGYARAWLLYATKEQGKDVVLENMINLNDPQMSWIPAGWIAVTAEDVNANGWIVGTATLGSSSRGFVLRPQSTVSQ